MILSTETVNTTDVCKALGTSARDIGVLCTHPNINMWSRMKPVQLKSPTPSRTISGEWWKGWKGNCGINMDKASTNSWEYIPTLYTADRKNGYQYEAPTGSIYPFRLADFRGYYQQATAPVHGFAITEKVSNQQGSNIRGQVDITDSQLDHTKPGSLTMEEIGGFVVNGEHKTLRDMYFGLVVCDQQNKVIKCHAMVRPGDTEEVSAHGLIAGTYRVFPFLCTVPQNGIQFDMATFFSVPNVSYMNVEVVTSLLRIDFYAEWVYRAGTQQREAIHYTINVYQDYETYMALDNNWLKIRKGNKSPDEGPDAYGEKDVKLPDVSANSGVLTLVKDDTIKMDFDQNAIYKLYVSMKSGYYWAYGKRGLEPEVGDFGPDDRY